MPSRGTDESQPGCGTGAQAGLQQRPRMPAPDRNATLEHPEDARAGGQRQAEQRLHAHHPHLWLSLLRARVPERQLLEGEAASAPLVAIFYLFLFCFYGFYLLTYLFTFSKNTTGRRLRCCCDTGKLR